MGRKRIYPIEPVDGIIPHLGNPSSLKNRHRFADSKYRHNVQFLFDVLRETFKENASKDDLLKNILENIIRMENNISLSVGSSKLSEHKIRFLKLIELEENLWKKEKIPLIWWTKMQGILQDILDAESDSSLDFSSVVLKHCVNNGIIERKEGSKKILPLIRPKPNQWKLHGLNPNSSAVISKRTKKSFTKKTEPVLSDNKNLTSNCISKKKAYKKDFRSNSKCDNTLGVNEDQNCDASNNYFQTVEYLLNNPQNS